MKAAPISRSSTRVSRADERASEPRPGPRGVPSAVEPARSSIALATVVGDEGGDRFRISMEGAERVATLDPSLDRRVVSAAMSSGARVVVEARGGSPAAAPVIVGALVTAPALTLDREGNVSAAVGRFEIAAKTEVLLKTAGAFVRLRPRSLEQYAAEVRVRGRDLVKVLAAVIGLN